MVNIGESRVSMLWKTTQKEKALSWWKLIYSWEQLPKILLFSVEQWMGSVTTTDDTHHQYQFAQAFIGRVEDLSLCDYYSETCSYRTVVPFFL